MPRYEGKRWIGLRYQIGFFLSAFMPRIQEKSISVLLNVLLCETVCLGSVFYETDICKILCVGFPYFSHDHRSVGCRDGMFFMYLELCMPHSQFRWMQRCLVFCLWLKPCVWLSSYATNLRFGGCNIAWFFICVQNPCVALTVCPRFKIWRM